MREISPSGEQARGKWLFLRTTDGRLEDINTDDRVKDKKKRKEGKRNKGNYNTLHYACAPGHARMGAVTHAHA